MSTRALQLRGLFRALGDHAALVEAELAMTERIYRLLGDLHEIREMRARYEDDHVPAAFAAIRQARGAFTAAGDRAAMLDGLTKAERAWDAFEALSEKRQAHAWAEVA